MRIVDGIALTDLEAGACRFRRITDTAPSPSNVGSLLASSLAVTYLGGEAVVGCRYHGSADLDRLVRSINRCPSASAVARAWAEMPAASSPGV
jgi:hypothetical protein